MLSDNRRMELLHKDKADLVEMIGELDTAIFNLIEKLVIAEDMKQQRNMWRACYWIMFVVAIGYPIIRLSF